MNPDLHKRDWNAIRLVMKVAEINYCVFIDFKINSLELHAVEKDEFEIYKYNPN